jgi:hypothetical protein
MRFTLVHQSVQLVASPQLSLHGSMHLVRESYAVLAAACLEASGLMVRAAEQQATFHWVRKFFRATCTALLTFPRVERS